MNTQTTHTLTWQEAFAQWQRIAHNATERAKLIKDARDAKAWELAASVGIGRCGCSLHNASIDTELRGWCKGNPHRLKVAKQATHILDDWTPYELAERISANAWNRLLVPLGA